MAAGFCVPVHDSGNWLAKPLALCIRYDTILVDEKWFSSQQPEATPGTTKGINTMTTITTIEELETLIDSTDKLYVRWSHGPEADAANGWISKNWAGTWQEWRGDYDYVPVDEAGLSATEMTPRATRRRGRMRPTVACATCSPARRSACAAMKSRC